MTRWRTPNFRGMRALILHQAGRNTQALVAQLDKLGVDTCVQWPASGVEDTDYEVVFFDADRGFDGLFPWPAGEAPIPLIAMTSSEAPGRLEWMLAQNPSGLIQKPIGSQGVFQSLVVATHFFQREQEQAQTIRDLNDRIMARALVVRAILILMRTRGVNDDEAFRLLRQQAMQTRCAIEEAAQAVVINSGDDAAGRAEPQDVSGKAADQS